MTDNSNTINTGNKPNLYIQEIIEHHDGQTEFRDIGAMWNKADYATGKLNIDGVEHKVIVRTLEQREALFAMREQKQSQGQTVTHAPTASPHP